MRTLEQRVLRVVGLAAVSVAPACVGLPPPPPGGGETSTGEVVDSSTVADATATSAAETSATGAGSSADTSAGSSTASGPEPSTSAGPACTPGEEGCACDERACDDGLSCTDDVCVTVLCGNGDVDDGEDCDDANRRNSDGCDDDCTISAGAVEVVAGDEHVCARFHTGNIKCWGAFDSGRLGYLDQTQDVGDDETPANVPFVNVGAPVVQLALGSNFTCALLDTDEVKCWGSGQHGRLGQGDQADLGSDQAPADIPAIDFGGGTPIHIAAGNEHACAVMESGELRCWGRNIYGQLGLPGVAMVGDDELPGEMPAVNLGEGIVAEQVAAGVAHTCALLGGGGVLCFGGDYGGQLGTPGPAENVGDDEEPAASNPVLLSDVAVLIAGRFDHTCVAYQTGTIQCWGIGSSGQLGYGNMANVGDDEDVALSEPVDPTGEEPTHFGMGLAHTCVRLATTQVYCWGEGLNGRLGYGDTTDQPAPPGAQVNLALPLAPHRITAGREFSCATTEGSQVKCWGRNNRGQLGYGAAWNTDLGDNEPIDAVGPVMIE
jgi:cysteine-rich repeat protein